MKARVSYENFDLKKVKVNSDGVMFSYEERGGKGYDAKIPSAPHPDLTKAIDQLKYYMAMRLNLIQPLEDVQELVGQNKEAHAKVDELIAEQTERCNVSGISFVGSGSLYGVKITGSLKCNGGVVGMATPNIIFESDKLGYEEDVMDICENIKKEVYYMEFKNKKAQLDLMDQAEEMEKEAKYDAENN